MARVANEVNKRHCIVKATPLRAAVPRVQDDL